MPAATAVHLRIWRGTARVTPSRLASVAARQVSLTALASWSSNNITDTLACADGGAAVPAHGGVGGNDNAMGLAQRASGVGHQCRFIKVMG